MNTAFNYLKSKVQMVPKIIFVLGGPGAGKGTQCQKIVKEYGFEHLSAGDLLRAERAKEGSAYKDLIEQCIRDGVIVPVEITCRLIENAMGASTNDKFLIDGFPRNKDNLDGWTREMSDKVNLMFVLFFECSQEVCMQRCLDRGAAGSGRSDDNVESLLKRFNTYLNDTMPIIDHYDKIGLVRRVDAGAPPDVVFNSVKKVFTDYMAQGDF